MSKRRLLRAFVLIALPAVALASTLKAAETDPELICSRNLDCKCNVPAANGCICLKS